VFNTPNEQSRPGYLSLGWREVGRVPVAMHPRSFRTLRGHTAAELWSQPLRLGDPVEPWVAAGGWERFDSRQHLGGPQARELTTRRSSDYLRWRYSLPQLHYRAVVDRGAAVIVRMRTRGRSTELVIAEQFGDHDSADALAARLVTRAGADHVVRLGAGNLRRGFVPLPRVGPVLTWRGVNDHGMPPLPNWNLSLGDIELF
jgi:hypothetical protein